MGLPALGLKRRPPRTTAERMRAAQYDFRVTHATALVPRVRTMRAMVFRGPGEPLRLEQRDISRPSAHELLMQVVACGVCRTDLHIVDGDLPPAHVPLIPGHEIVGRVVEVGSDVAHVSVGERVGVPWLGWTDGTCQYCTRDQENLCEHALFTGYSRDGGYADYALADARYTLPIPARYTDSAAAPLLCAGLIGYRAYRVAGPDIEHVGLYGFGAAAHLIAQIAVHQGRRVYAFTRPGDSETQAFARLLGATWAGGSDEPPPHPLDAALLFAPVGALVPAALTAVRPGGTVVAGGIHMSDIPSFPYRLLWSERTLRSVANLTRRDGHEFMRLAAEIPLEVHKTEFALADANDALRAVRLGHIDGAAVLSV